MSQTSVQPNAPQASARPRKPRSSWRSWLVVVVLLAITWWAGSARYGIDANFLEVIDNFANGWNKFVELLQPNFAVFGETVEPMLQSIEMGLLASVLGCLVGLPVSFLASRVTMPSAVLRGPIRAVLSVIRSIPDVLYAVLLVSIVGVGPLGGLLALLFFSVGILVKLLAEVIDAVDTGPQEAALSAGATRFGANRTAVLPQVLPNFWGFALYILELNIRTGTVLGLVSAGGIGQTLNVWRKFYRYNDVSLIVLEILVVVLLLELVSSIIRRRLS